MLSAAMTLFGMAAIDDIPTNKQYFPTGSEKLPPPERKHLLLMATGAVVDKYVDLQFVRKKKAKRDSSAKAAEIDRVQQYASEVLTLGLLLMEFIDAIREGDGDRIIRCWRFFLPLFKSTRRKNYAVESFILLAQLDFLFSPRMAAHAVKVEPHCQYSWQDRKKHPMRLTHGTLKQAVQRMHNWSWCQHFRQSSFAHWKVSWRDGQSYQLLRFCQWNTRGI